MQGATRLFAEPGDVLDAVPDVIPDELEFIRVEIKALERAGQGAHAAFNAGGDELGEQIEQPLRVFQPLR